MPWDCKMCTYRNEDMKAVKCCMCDRVREIALGFTQKRPSKKELEKRKDEPIIGVTPFTKDLGEWEDEEDDDEEMEDGEGGEGGEGEGEPGETKENDRVLKPSGSSSSTSSSSAGPARKKSKKKNQEEEDLWGDDGEEEIKSSSSSSSGSTTVKKDDSDQGIDQPGGIDDEGKEDFDIVDKIKVPKLQKDTVDTTAKDIKKSANLWPPVKSADPSELKDDFGGFDHEGDTPMTPTSSSSSSPAPDKEKEATLAAASALTRDEVILLLRAHNYYPEKVYQAWAADYNKCKKESGFLPLEPPPDTPSEIDCNVCCDTFPTSKAFALQCGHYHCETCWKGWLTAEYDKGPRALLATCPFPKCPIIVPFSVHLKFLAKEKSKVKKLTEYDLDTFVQGNPFVRWCPGKKCTRAIRRYKLESRGVKCNCGKKWCFECREDDHTPCGCAEAKAWNERINKEGGNAEYILANTKICPKCKVNIEKNQGCQHMTCSQCRHEFCWLCGGDWRNHSACNSYKKGGKGGESGEWTGADTEGADGKQPSKESLRKSLERWVHYHDRFLAHKNSAEFAKKTLAEAYRKAMQLKEIKGVDLQPCLFLVEAAKEIMGCRSVLSWSYVYAYYVAAKDTNSQRLLFETHQEKLENFTDQLHELLEKPIGFLMENEVSTQIMRQTGVVRKFRKNVVMNVTKSPLPSSLDPEKSATALDPRAYVPAKRKALFSLLPKAKDLPKGFSCRACTFLNKEDLEQCEVCGTSRY